MRPIFDAKWKLPRIPLKKLNPKLQQDLTPLPPIHIPHDVARNDTSLSFLHAKNRLELLDDQLAAKRQRCLEVSKNLTRKWRSLTDGENRLRTLVIHHNGFIKKNLEKRMRANLRMTQNQKLTETRQKNIEDLKKEIDIANFLMDEFKSQIVKHNIYDDFLTKLTGYDESPYKTINDLLNRVEILINVKEERVKNHKQESLQIIIVHQNMKEMVHSKLVILIGLRNELNNLRCQFDEVCRKNLASETLIASIVSRSNELRSEVSSCQYMIDAIYRYICQRRKIPQADYSLTNVKPKIDVLKSTLGVWSQILSSSELMKRKKSLKTYRKSYAGKASAVQGIYMWKKKISRAGLS